MRNHIDVYVSQQTNFLFWSLYWHYSMQTYLELKKTNLQQNARGHIYLSKDLEFKYFYCQFQYDEWDFILQQAQRSMRKCIFFSSKLYTCEFKLLSSFCGIQFSIIRKKYTWLILIAWQILYELLFISKIYTNHFKILDRKNPGTRTKQNIH